MVNGMQSLLELSEGALAVLAEQPSKLIPVDEDLVEGGPEPGAAQPGSVPASHELTHRCSVVGMLLRRADGGVQWAGP